MRLTPQACFSSRNFRSQIRDFEQSLYDLNNLNFTISDKNIRTLYSIKTRTLY